MTCKATALTAGTAEILIMESARNAYPTIPFFEKKGLLRCVDGTGTIEAVSKKIDSIIGIS